jgi:HAD superfamily hydrolase (TIGR01490 family)
LLAGDSDYLWGEFLCERGLVDRAWYEGENRRFFELYEAGTLDIHAFAAFSFAPLAAHPLGQLQTWRAEFLRDKIEPIVAPGAPALLERHRAQGDRLLITSATNRFVTEPIAALLGVETLIATDPEFDGTRYHARIAGTPNFREGKVQRLREWIAVQGAGAQHIACYSDSHNDLPLLEMADAPCAVDPDPRLRAQALARGWPVITLRAPLPEARATTALP